MDLAEPQIPAPEAKPWEVLTKRALEVLDLAISLSPQMTEDESVIDVAYIREKLTKITHAAEELGDQSLQMTKSHLEIVRLSRDSKALAQLHESGLKRSETYRGLPREERTPWINEQMVVYRSKDQGWQEALEVSTEVRTAIADRIQGLRRLDSALRLYQKLLDAGPGVGATGSPLSLPGQLPPKYGGMSTPGSDDDEIHLV